MPTLEPDDRYDRCRAHRPAVAVVTPTKNRLALLRETMNFVQAQTIQGWEHLIVDDGSEDGTADEVARRSRTDRPGFAFFAEPETGAPMFAATSVYAKARPT